MVVAFSNSVDGGKLIVGVDDERHIIGVESEKIDSLCQRMEDAISDAIVPQVSRNVYVQSLNGEPVLVVEVFPGLHKPYHVKRLGVKEGTFIRIGASSRVADEYSLDELRLKGVRETFDSIENLETPVTAERTRSIIEGVRKMYDIDLDEKDLLNCGVIRKRLDSYVSTNAYALLCKDTSLIHTTIQCAIFKNHGDTDFLDLVEYECPLYEQIENAYLYVLRNIRKAGKVEGLIRMERYEVPPKAIREAIINAVQHRSYVNGRRTIHIAIYDDRIEITSPGILLLDEDELSRGRTEHRNPVISKFFRRIHLCEGWGNGVLTIFNACKEYGLREPTIEGSSKDVRVTLWRKMDVVENGSHIVENEPGVVENPPDRVGTILMLMAEDPSISIQKMASELGVSGRTVDRTIKRMKAEGLVSREGSKGGKWVILRVSRRLRRIGWEWGRMPSSEHRGQLRFLNSKRAVSCAHIRCVRDRAVQVDQTRRQGSAHLRTIRSKVLIG